MKNLLLLIFAGLMLSSCKDSKIKGMKELIQRYNRKYEIRNLQ